MTRCPDHKEQGGPVDRHRAGTREAWILLLPMYCGNLGTLLVSENPWQFMDIALTLLRMEFNDNPIGNNEREVVKEPSWEGAEHCPQHGLSGPPAGSGSCVSVVKTTQVSCRVPPRSQAACLPSGLEMVSSLSSSLRPSVFSIFCFCSPRLLAMFLFLDDGSRLLALGE